MPQRNQPQAQSRAIVTQPPRPDGAGAALAAVSREIDGRLGIIEASAAAGIRPERLKLVALTAFTRNPDLLKCSPVSLARAIVEAGQLGLEPTGLLGGAYLVPRGGEATLLIGYSGLVRLMRRSGEVGSVEARVVRERDQFAYSYGLDPVLRHVPAQDGGDPGPLTYAYAIIRYRNGERQFDVMSRAEIEAVRKRSSSPERGPWVTDYFEMAKKTPLRRLSKLAPLEPDIAAKLDELDPEVAEGGLASADGAQPRRPDATAALRRRLQGELEREFGPDEVEGTARDLGNVNAAPPADAKASVAAGAAARGEEAGAATGAASGPANTAPCGIVSEPLGVGPCVLPAGHVEGPWRHPLDPTVEHGPQREHEDASGVHWTMPAPPAQR